LKFETGDNKKAVEFAAKRLALVYGFVRPIETKGNLGGDVLKS
jgi:hypothetical protein